MDDMQLTGGEMQDKAEIEQQNTQITRSTQAARFRDLIVQELAACFEPQFPDVLRGDWPQALSNISLYANEARVAYFTNNQTKDYPDAKK